MKGERDIDKITELVKQSFPSANVEQLKVKFPADDDGIWYFWLPDIKDDDIQVENSYGQCPFILETNRSSEAKHGESIEKTVSIICEHLRTSPKSNER